MVSKFDHNDIIGKITIFSEKKLSIKNSTILLSIVPKFVLNTEKFHTGEVKS